MQNGLKHKLVVSFIKCRHPFHFSEERLNPILQNWIPSVRNVVEFRHKSCGVKNVYDAFKHQITFCGQSYPGDIPEDVIQNHSTVYYYRFHGKPVL